MDESFSIRPAAPEDAALLGIVAPAAYSAAYAYLWDDAAAFADQLNSFNADVFSEQINGPKFDVWIAETGGVPVGFLTLKYDSAEPVSKKPGGAEIPRIYFLPQAAGRGLAKALMAEAEKAARARGARYLWLDAMASAGWAQRAYKKWGFSAIGRDRFPKNVREGEADMIVMMKALN